MENPDKHGRRPGVSLFQDTSISSVLGDRTIEIEAAQRCRHTCTHRCTFIQPSIHPLLQAFRCSRCQAVRTVRIADRLHISDGDDPGSHWKLIGHLEYLGITGGWRKFPMEIPMGKSLEWLKCLESHVESLENPHGTNKRRGFFLLRKTGHFLQYFFAPSDGTMRCNGFQGRARCRAASNQIQWADDFKLMCLKMRLDPVHDNGF